jgi:hypothetical protein
MEISNKYKIRIEKTLLEDDLSKGSYISILHASRVPPHIGMIFNDRYHSLSVKGQEINYPVNALLKNSRIRKIPSVFIRIKQHPAFSNEYLNDHFISNIRQFDKVETGKATCLSPIKLFFKEAYHLPMQYVNYLFELLPELEKNDLIDQTSALFIEEGEFALPTYSFKEINNGINIANDEIKEIKKAVLNNSRISEF